MHTSCTDSESSRTRIRKFASEMPGRNFSIDFLKKHPARMLSNGLSALKMGSNPLEAPKALREPSSVLYGEMAIFGVFRTPYTGSYGPNAPLKGPKWIPKPESSRNFALRRDTSCATEVRTLRWQPLFCGCCTRTATPRSLKRSSRARASTPSSTGPLSTTKSSIPDPGRRRYTASMVFAIFTLFLMNPIERSDMLSLDEIMALSKEEFTEKWKSGEIQDSSLKLLGRRAMTEEDKRHLEEGS